MFNFLLLFYKHQSPLNTGGRTTINLNKNSKYVMQHGFYRPLLPTDFFVSVLKNLLKTK